MLSAGSEAGNRWAPVDDGHCEMISESLTPQSSCHCMKKNSYNEIVFLTVKEREIEMESLAAGKAYTVQELIRH